MKPANTIESASGVAERGTLVEALELFQFAGEKRPRLAWVTWRVGDGERRAVSVREYVR